MTRNGECGHPDCPCTGGWYHTEEESATMTRILTVEGVATIKEGGVGWCSQQSLDALIASHEALRERVRELEEKCSKL